MDSSIKKNSSTIDILSTEYKKYLDVFFNHLKAQYDYDNVSLFTFKTPFENYNFSVLTDALNSILSVKLRNPTKEDIERHKVFVLNYFDTIINIDEFNINKFVERFIFPLNEDVELLNSWNINPQLTYDFMNVDYSNFWDIKMMVQI